MNTQILQENFMRALSQVGRIIPPRPQLPILQNIKMKSTKEGIEMIATNMETSINVWVGAKTQKEGEACVPARLLTEFVATLPQSTITMTLEDGSLAVSCGTYKANIPTAPVAEFPQTPSFEEKGGTKTNKKAFIEAISSVLFAAATDEGRPVLTGVKVKKDEEGIILAATDGYRLSVRHVHTALALEEGVVIPAKALFEVVKMCQEEKEGQELVVSKLQDKQIGFKIGETSLFTRLLSGEYPSFERIIPKNFTTRTLVDKELLLHAAKSAAIFARDNANIIKLSFAKQKITVSANAPQTGGNTVDVDAKIDGDGGDIAFNSRFLIEYLSNTTEEDVLFEMTGALNPGVFKSPKDEGQLHIIMPVRISG